MSLLFAIQGGIDNTLMSKRKFSFRDITFGSSFSMPVGAGNDGWIGSDSIKSRFRNFRFSCLSGDRKAPIRERGLIESLSCFRKQESGLMLVKSLSKEPPTTAKGGQCHKVGIVYSQMSTDTRFLGHKFLENYVHAH